MIVKRTLILKRSWINRWLLLLSVKMWIRQKATAVFQIRRPLFGVADNAQLLYRQRTATVALVIPSSRLLDGELSKASSWTLVKIIQYFAAFLSGTSTFFSRGHFEY